MDALRVLFCLFILIKTCDKVDGGCSLSLKDDFGTPSPVYLRNGNFLEPNATGSILLRHSEILEIACPGNKRFIVLSNETTSFSLFKVKCVKDSTFQAAKSSWVGSLKDIKCTGPPWFTAEEIGKCYGEHKLYGVGYRIENKFHSLYEACFNKDLLHTLYVKQELKPNAIHIQLGSRPQFIEGGLFGKTKISTLYKASHQKDRLREVLGDGMQEKYITKTQYLSRGHLAPRADFPLLAEQRASFHYINTAPQWQRGNAGDWAALEDAVRRRVHSYGSPLTIYTGTYGVMTLADKTSNLKEFYLDVDGNNNEVLPVPMYFYKIVHDPAKQTAAAFLSINSSFYNKTMLNKLSFCEDICEQNPKYSWLRWRSNDGTHSFCCSYEDFVGKIHVLPKLNVKGVFY